MKIYELVKKLNTKVSVKYSDVLDVKKYYLSLYRTFMVEMYDKGYISDPTVFVYSQIYKNILDMNIKYLTGVTGKIELSEDYIGYALTRYKDNEEISEFLSLLLQVVKYRNISMNIDKFYDDCEMNGGNKKKISLNIVQAASRIYSKNGYNIDEGVLRCLYGFKYDINFVSLDKWVYYTALSELGISHELKGSLFVKGLTREEEIKYSRLILNGLVKLDGIYSSKLEDWLRNNKWAGDNKFSSQNEGLYNWILYIKSNNTIEEQAKLLNELINGGIDIVSMKSNGYYILQERSTIEVPVGVFAVVSGEEDSFLPDINKLEGYTGEAYPLEYLVNEEISYVGCPLELFVNSKNTKKALFIDKEQTDMKDSISWFASEGAVLSFNDEFVVENKLDNTTLEGKLQDMLVNSEKGIWRGSLSLEDFNSITDSVKKSVTNSVY